MKKLALILLVLLMAAPCMAAITISAVQDGCGGVSINYVCDGAHASSGGKALIAGMAFDVSVDNGCILSTIDGYKDDGESTAGSPGYGVYMKEAQINMGDPCNPAWVAGIDPVAAADDSDMPGQLGSGEITIQFGALFDDPCDTLDNAPVSSGTLCVLTVTDPCDAGTCNLSIALDDARGGIVMTDQSVPDPCDVTAEGAVICFGVADCVKDTASFYAEWVGAGKNWDKPDCWCYERQCRGDLNGLKAGLFWVQATDLAIFLSGFNKMDGALDQTKICADLNHIKTGLFRSQATDLAIFLTYFNKMQGVVPPCPADDYNFWIVP